LCLYMLNALCCVRNGDVLFDFRVEIDVFAHHCKLRFATSTTRSPIEMQILIHIMCLDGYIYPAPCGVV
jgi:hypothetical protein